MAPSQDDGLPLSLRPFPVADGKMPKNVADFIARVNAQPGGFRALTEAKLALEISAGEAVEDDASGRMEVESPDAADADDATAVDPGLARLEVLRNIDIANNTAMLTLDTLSLLISKQSPSSVTTTLSQHLRDMVGIGTLGSDKLDEPNISEARSKEQEEVAIGWTLMEIDAARTAANEAAAFLASEVEAECRYWQDVMTIKSAGWSICRVPNERQSLGVRFGFSEAAPEFQSLGLAPMRRRDGGLLQLDLGRLGSLSEGLVVTYEKDGKVVGRCLPRRPALADDLGSQARLLDARDTVFSKELWHELTREARSLAAYDVRLDGQRLRCSLDASSTIILELLPLQACPQPDNDPGLPQNSMAKIVSSALHILLSYAHRHNELMRTRPLPPHIPRSRGLHPYALLRPVIARVGSLAKIQSCLRYLGHLTGALQKAGFAASFSLQTPPPAADLEAGLRGPNQLASSQRLVRQLLQPIDFLLNLTILPAVSLAIRGRTLLFPVTATYFYLLRPPPWAASQPPGAGPQPDGFPDFAAVRDYLVTTVAQALVRHFLARLADASPPRRWAQGVLGTSIRPVDSDETELRFALNDDDMDSANDHPPPSLSLTCDIAHDGRVKAESWSWSSAAASSSSRTMAQAVDHAVGMLPS